MPRWHHASGCGGGPYMRFNLYLRLACTPWPQPVFDALLPGDTLHQAAALFLSLALAGNALAQTSPLIPADQAVKSLPQLEWSQRWWQWALSFDRVRSPVADRTGQMCASRQSGDVWFLAGTYGTARTERTCHVPAGKTLFFPLINYVTYRVDDSDESCASLVARAAALTDRPSVLVLNLDGQQFDQLQTHRLAQSRCFSLVPGQPADAASNGYYVALKPLSRGAHTLHFGGILPSMAQAVTYHLVMD